MSIITYKTESNYYYVLEIGMPESTVRFGEGDTPEGAVESLSSTQYQSAYFGCRGPANADLHEYFDSIADDEVIVDCTDDEDKQSEAAYRNA